MKSSTQYEDKPFHPLLPTPQQAHENSDQIYSDHLPILTVLPLYPQNELHVVSWNVFDENQAYGFKLPNVGDTIETLPDSKKRHDKIIQTLIRFFDHANNNAVHADVVVLQEVSNALIARLESSGDQLPFRMVKSDSGKLTLYSPEKLKLIGEPVDDLRSGMLTTRFSCDGQTFSITNAHLGHQDLPVDTEDQVIKVLKNKNNGDVNHLVLGDFNCRIAPTDRESRLIMTGVCPASFRRDDNGREIGQGIDWTDGAFCLSQRGSLVQLPCETIDPMTGAAFNMPKVQGLLDGRNAAQQKELSEFRISMCCADEFKFNPVFSGEQTIYQYQDNLREITGDPQLLVRMGANALNEQAVCICTANHEVINKIAEKLPGSHYQLKRFESGMTPTFMLSLPLANVAHLECAILAAQGQEWQLLEAAMRTMESRKLLNFSPTDEERLAKTIIKLLSKNKDDSVVSVILCSIMMSGNEKLKSAISAQFGIRPEKLIQVYNSRLNPDIIGRSLINSVSPLVDAINANDVKSIERIAKTWQQQPSPKKTNV